MESYRSGHNEPDSKSGSPKGLEGSNPSLSVDKDCAVWYGLFCVLGRCYQCFTIQNFVSVRMKFQKNSQYVFTYRAVLTNVKIVTIPNCSYPTSVNCFICTLPIL